MSFFGTLYVYPEPDMDLKCQPLYVTSVKDLISFAGSVQDPVRYVNFEGVEFRHAHRVVMEPEKNWEPLNRGDWSIVRSGAVMLTGTEYCTIKDCFFNATGGNGVFFNNYNRHSAVTDCRFEKLGDSAVAFVGNYACTRSNAIGYENSIAYSKQDLTLEDAQSHTSLYRGGTVIPANGTIYVAANRVAFRSRNSVLLKSLKAQGSDEKVIQKLQGGNLCQFREISISGEGSCSRIWGQCFFR